MKSTFVIEENEEQKEFLHFDEPATDRQNNAKEAKRKVQIGYNKHKSMGSIMTKK